MALLAAGIALGAAGYLLASPALSGLGFASAVAALVAWLFRDGYAQRSAPSDGAARRQRPMRPEGLATRVIAGLEMRRNALLCTR